MPNRLLYFHFPIVFEYSFKTGIVLFVTQPFSLNAVLWLILAAFILFVSRVCFEVFLGDSFNDFFKYIKNKANEFRRKK